MHATVVVVVGAREGELEDLDGVGDGAEGLEMEDLDLDFLDVWRSEEGRGREEEDTGVEPAEEGGLGAVGGREEVEGLDDEGASGWKDLDEERAGRGGK